jgi:hypothetical protein
LSYAHIPLAEKLSPEFFGKHRAFSAGVEGRHFAALPLENPMPGHYRSTEAALAQNAGDRRIEAAIRKLYLRRGGYILDLQIRMYTATLEMATLCREAEAVEVREGKITREPGSRPMVTVSEGRLHSGKIDHYTQRRDELLASIRSEVMHAVQSWGPRNEQELILALDSVLKENDATVQQAVKDLDKQMDELHAMQAKVNEPIVNLIKQIVDLDTREEMLVAFNGGDANKVGEIVMKQKSQWQKDWREALERRQGELQTLLKEHGAAA